MPVHNKKKKGAYIKMKASRINLEWGGGIFNVIVDWKNSIIFPYASSHHAEYVHNRFGGKNYYVSRIGKSGAGWIPNHVNVTQVSTYRVDVGCVEVFSDYLWKSGVCVPIDYSTKSVSNNYPILFTNGHHVVYCDEKGFFDTVAEKTIPRSEHVSFSVIPSVNDEQIHYDYRVLVAGHPRNLRKAVEAVNAGDLIFPYSNATSKSSKFWKRLGLYRFAEDEGNVYKITSGVCRYKAPNPETIEDLSAIAPKNVFVLSLQCYLQKIGNGFEVVGYHVIEGKEYECEIHISFSEGVRLMQGYLDTRGKVLQEVQNHCWQKYYDEKACEEAQAKMENGDGPAWKII